VECRRRCRRKRSITPVRRRRGLTRTSAPIRRCACCCQSAAQPWAIAAGYLGLFRAAADFCAFRADRVDHRHQRHQKRNGRGMGRAIFGLIMGAIFTVILLIMVGTMVFGR
jgi:hypothetical protein